MSRKTKTEETFNITWDENDPKESILNQYTENDFKALIQNYSNVKNKKIDTSNKDTSVKTQRSLETNLSKVASTPKTTSPKQPKKTTKTSGTTRKARVKKGSVLEFKPTRSRDLTLFPHPHFPYRIEIKNEKRIAWFECEEHAIKFLHRHHPKPFTHFKYYVFPQDQPATA